MTIYTQSGWNLEDLFPSPHESAIQSHQDELDELVCELENAKSSLNPNISHKEFLRLLGIFEQQSAIASRLSAFTNLWFYEDTQNPEALNLRGRIDQALAQAGNRILFFTLWFKELPDESAERLIQASGGHAYFLRSMRLFKPHTLSEAEEQIINLKDVDGIDALVEMYDLILNRLTFSLIINGGTKKLTRDQLGAYFRHPKAEQRSAAYRELLRVFNENRTLLSQIYIHRVRDWHTEAIELRHFAQPISYRNLNNDIPGEVVDALLSVCRSNASVFQRYFRLKASLLGMEKLHRFDIYAPLASSERKFDYSQAVEMVVSSFKEFNPEVAHQVERVIKDKHLDSENRPSKRSGAFCYAALPGLTPWVLVNYAGQARDVATLAHELGHAVHAMQSADQSILSFWPAQPLSETASIFSEMLLTDRLLGLETDVTLRRELLAHAIDDAFATVLRQAYFTIFELQAHQIINDGGSVEDVCDSYFKNLVEQFGDSVELEESFRWEWISIPHIYKSPFYTYSYCFGQLMVLALFQQYKTLGTDFVPRYLKILSYGGSATPAEILAEAGIDISAAGFWQDGFNILENMIQQLEEI
ncbi:MAG: M3 family oligoendopeptidase [Anaerolineales bacterium]